MIEWHEAVVPIIVEDPSLNAFVMEQNPVNKEPHGKEGIAEPDIVPPLSSHQHAVSEQPAVTRDGVSKRLPSEQEPTT